MKLDPVVRRESAYMAVSALLCTALVQLGFFLLGRWDVSVLLGGIVGWVVTSGNFFLMSLNVQKAVECGDESQAKLKMRASYTWRTSAILGVMIVTFIVDAIHWLPVVCAVFYPRIVITVRQIWQRFTQKTPEEAPSAPVTDVPAEEEEEDEFEKAIGHFAPKIKADCSAADSDKDKKEADKQDSQKGRS